MSEEERKGEVAPEVEAAWEQLEVCARELLVTRADSEYAHLASIDAKLVRIWVEIVLSDDVAGAFWRRVLGDVDFWLNAVKRRIEDHDILLAVGNTQRALKTLVRYAELLGVVIPPEEEVPEVPSAAEEVEPEAIVEEPPAPEPVEGTPLLVLELSTRVHNILCRCCPHPKGQRLFVEDVLKVLEEEGEVGLLALKSFGKKALEETLAALRAKSFLSEEPQTESFGEVLERIKRPF